MHDPSGPMAPPNEIWVSSTNDPRGNLVPNQQGVARGSGSADWVARQQPLSVMIHEPEFPGLPIACADFAAYDAPAARVVPADDGEGPGAPSVEYLLAGGEGVAHEAASEVSEPGSHPVARRAADYAGNVSEVQELEFAVAGEDEEPEPEPEPVEVTPEPVVFDVRPGCGNDTFTIPSVEGVEYLVDGEVLPAGTYAGDG